MGFKITQPTECIWHEIYPGVFQRSMTPLERFFDPLLGWSVWSSIKLAQTLNISNNEQDFIDRLRRAWIQILYEQPHLASIYNVRKNTCAYTTTTVKSLASWLQDTFVITEDPYTCIATREKPTLSINPVTREIFFRAPHYYMDGTGILLLLSDLVSHFANPQTASFGNESSNLSTVFDIAANLPAPIASDFQRGKDLTNTFLQNQPSIGLPLLSPLSATSQHSVSTILLSLADSKTLISACKARKWTVTHAIHTSLILAVAELSPESLAAESYTSLQVYNWRSRLETQYQKHRCALYVGAFPMSVPNPAEKEFAVLVEEIKRMYLSTKKDEGIARAQGPWWGELIKVLGQAGDDPPASVVATPILSSLGVIERYLPNAVDGVGIEEFSFGIDVKGPVITTYAWSWEGRVSISATWGKGVFEEDLVNGFLDSIVTKLGEGLNVSFGLKSD